MSDTRILGGCLCGAFQFAVRGPLADVRLCHCDTCRRANGSAFSANCRVPRDRFELLTDASTLREYQSSPNAWRMFCGTCGSPAYARTERDPDAVRIRLGTLAREAQVNIVGHVWVTSKAAWDRICDDLPCFEQASS